MKQQKNKSEQVPTVIDYPCDIFYDSYLDKIYARITTNYPEAEVELHLDSVRDDAFEFEISCPNSEVEKHLMADEELGIYFQRIKYHLLSQVSEEFKSINLTVRTFSDKKVYVIMDDEG